MSSEKAAPMSVAERQQALRAKREMLGLTEVRGIYLPPEKHAELKALAAKMLKRRRLDHENSNVPPSQSESTMTPEQAKERFLRDELGSAEMPANQVW